MGRRIVEGTWKEVLRVGKGRLPNQEIRPPWIRDRRHHLSVNAEQARPAPALSLHWYVTNAKYVSTDWLSLSSLAHPQTHPAESTTAGPAEPKETGCLVPCSRRCCAFPLPAPVARPESSCCSFLPCRTRGTAAQDKPASCIFGSRVAYSTSSVFYAATHRDGSG
jgi:hypothetical protein